MKSEQTNFNPDEIDQALEALDAINVDALTPEQLGEALVAGFAVQEQILDAWGRDLAAQTIGLGLDPKALRLPIPRGIKP